MQRRSFLGAMVATAAGLLAPARLLEDDPKRVYSFVRRPRGKPMLRIYTGMAPMNADAAITRQTLLSEIEFNATRFPVSRGMALSFSGSGFSRRAFGEPVAFQGVDRAANATGIATFARLVDADGATVLDIGDDELMLHDGAGNPTRTIVTGATIATSLELPGVLADGLV